MDPIEVLTFESLFNEQIDDDEDDEENDDDKKSGCFKSICFETDNNDHQLLIKTIDSQLGLDDERTSTSSSSSSSRSESVPAVCSEIQSIPTGSVQWRSRDRESEAQLSQFSDATTIDTVPQQIIIEDGPSSINEPPNQNESPVPLSSSSSSSPGRSFSSSSSNRLSVNKLERVVNISPLVKSSRKSRRSSHVTARSEVLFPASLLLFDSTQRLKRPVITKNHPRFDSCGLQDLMLGADGKAKKFISQNNKLTDTSKVTGPGFAILPPNIAASPAAYMLGGGLEENISDSNIRIPTPPSPPSSPGVVTTSNSNSSSPVSRTGRRGCRHSSHPIVLMMGGCSSSTSTSSTVSSPASSILTVSPTAVARRRASLMPSTSFTSCCGGGSSSPSVLSVTKLEENESVSPASSVRILPKARTLFGRKRIITLDETIPPQTEMDNCQQKMPLTTRRKLALRALKVLGLSSSSDDKITYDNNNNNNNNSDRHRCRNNNNNQGLRHPTNYPTQYNKSPPIKHPTFEWRFNLERHSSPTNNMGTVNCCGERPDRTAKKLARESAAKFLSGKGIPSDLDRFDEAYAKDDIVTLIELVPSEEPFEQSTDEHLHPWAASPKTVGALASTQLAALASTDDMDIKEKIKSAGAIQVLIQQLDSNHQDRVDAALVALSFLSIDFTKACVGMFEANIFPHLIRLLRSSKVGVKAAAAQTARNIYVLEVRYRRAFREVGGCQPLVDLLDFQSEDEQDSNNNSLDLQFEAIYHIDDFIMFNGEEVADCVAAIKGCSAARKLNVLQNVKGNDDICEAAHQLYLRLAE